MKHSFPILLACLTWLPAGDNQAGPPVDTPADPPPGPPSFRVQLEIPRVEAQPGATVEVPIYVDADGAISMVTVSLELDTAILDVLDVRLSAEVQAILELNQDAEHDFFWTVNEAEGWLQASLVLDFQAREASTLPPGRHLAFVLVLQLSPEATNGSSPLVFTRNEQARYRGNFSSSKGPVYNAARGHGKPYNDKDKFEDSIDPGLTDGVLEIIGDIGLFRRGDANLDFALDVSDSVTILGYLFLGAEDSLSCLDAADSNDDGSVDVSDPIGILNYLFAGIDHVGLSGPYPVEDATPDELGCASY